MKSQMVQEAINEVKGRLSALTAELDVQKRVLTLLEEADGCLSGGPDVTGITVTRKVVHRKTRKKRGEYQIGAGGWPEIFGKLLAKGPIARKELIAMAQAERGGATYSSTAASLAYAIRKGRLGYSKDGKVALA